MNDLHTVQGRNATGKARRRAQKQGGHALGRAIRNLPPHPPQGVFRGPITSPLQQLARHQQHAAKKVVHARQQLPDVKRANRNIRRLTQRENPQYRKVTHRTIGKVLTTRAAPRGARQPHVRILPLVTLPSGRLAFGNHPYAAYVLGNSRTMNVTPDAVHGTFAHGRGAAQTRLYYRETPIHEFAHTLQRPGLSDAEAEGGAEAWALMAAQDIGLRPIISPSYAKYVRKARRRGLSYILRGQFR